MGKKIEFEDVLKEVTIASIMAIEILVVLAGKIVDFKKNIS